MEKMEFADSYERTCIGYYYQDLRLRCFSLFEVERSLTRSSSVYSVCGIFMDCKSSMNWASPIFASSAALPKEMSFFWKRKRATDSCNTSSGSERPTVFMLFISEVLSFIGLISKMFYLKKYIILIVICQFYKEGGVRVEKKKQGKAEALQGYLGVSKTLIL